MMKTLSFRPNSPGLWLGLVLWFTLAATLHAQPYAISETTISNGGSDSTSADGRFALSGTIGQPTDTPASGGEYGVATGFWSVVLLVQTPAASVLTINKVGGDIVISWPETTDAFFLQETDSLNEPVTWTTSSAKPVIDNGFASITLPITGGLRFFRLYHPE